MNAYQKRKAERDFKRKVKYQEKRDKLILAELAEATCDALESLMEHDILHRINTNLCGCKGEDNG